MDNSFMIQNRYFLYNGVVLETKPGDWGRVDAIAEYEEKKKKQEKREQKKLKKLIKEAVLEALHDYCS